LSDEVKAITNPETFEWIKILIPTVVAFIAGAFGSVIAPWANWGIKKKEILLNNRKQLIEEVRNKLAEDGLSTQSFVHSELYIKIKPILSKKTIESLEKIKESKITQIEINMLDVNTISYHFANILYDIQIKEKNWGLI